MARWRFVLTDWLRSSWQQVAILAVAAAMFVIGVLWHHAGVLGVGAALLCLTLRRVGGETSQTNNEPSARRHQRSSAPGYDEFAPRSSLAHSMSDRAHPAGQSPRLLDEPRRPGAAKSTDALVNELLATGRYALLLRPETKQHLTQAHVIRAIRQLDEEMALVPAGRVLLGQLAEQSSSACGTSDVDHKLVERNLLQVSPAYLDRYCVTNEQYQQFVDAGGYEQLELWHEEALPALLDFVDETGAPGPRYWSDGQYASGEGRLPVVGISWYEAWAYARWAGKRLPTDAEWTKAGAWPVEASPGRIAQRRYPWGESFDMRRAHLYGSGNLATVPVDEYPGGVSVGGIHQLIGNVWEWSSSPLAELGDPTLHVSESIMSIRGGAFDTYFENQATCHYQSGEHPLSRRPNIGFRLALAMSDLEPGDINDDDDDGDVEPPVTDPVDEVEVEETEEVDSQELATTN